MNKNLHRLSFFYFFMGLYLLCATVVAEDFQAHGFGKIDLFTNLTPYPCLFYSEARPLSTQLGADGSVVRLKSLKTGFGSYYRVAKKGKDIVWKLYADIKDPKDVAAQFSITHEGDKYITLSSDVADDMYLYSASKEDPKTGLKQFEVSLKKEFDDSCFWELVEDPKCGDTLTVAHLKNKATGGFLMATYDASGSTDATKLPALQNEITQLKEEIKQLEKDNPYLIVTWARTQGQFWSYDTAASRDIAPALNAKIDPQTGELHLTGGWAEELSGISSVSAGIAGTRKVRIRYKLYGSSNEETWEERENTEFYLKPDISKHPATLRKAELAKKEQELQALNTTNERVKSLASSDVGKTGFFGSAAGLGQSTKLSVETVVYLPNEDDGGAPKDTIAPGYSMKSYVWAHRSPQFIGHGRYRLDNFGPEMIVTVNPLKARGFAWIEEALPVPGKGTVSFRALSTGGDVHVCFSNSVAPQTVYKIAFGAAENTQTTIYKNGEAVQSMSVEQNKNARIMPGMIEQLWVSINNGLIMLGKGDPGTNIIMAWQDPSPAKNIERVGFSTLESTVKFADVQKVNNPIAVIPPQGAYVTDSRPIQVGSGDAPAWYSLPLSPADAGTVVFEAKGSEEASLILSNANKEGYKITFGAEGNTATLVERLKDGQDLYRIDAGMLPLAGLKSDAVNKFWVSFYKGLMFIGSGEAGKNTFCAFVDASYPTGISKIGFAGKASIQNLEIWPEVEVGLEPTDDASQYSVSRRFSPFKGALSIISPFEYKISQEGPALRFRDMLTGTLFQVNGTPMPDAEYHVKVDVLETGLPQVILLYQDPSQEKKSMEYAVKMIDASAEGAFRMAQTLAYATGPEIISSSVAIGLSAGLGLGGTALKVVGADLQAKIDQISELGSRYIYTEAIQKQAGGSAEISVEAQTNRANIASKLEAILQLQMSDPAQLDYATKQWSDILNLVTDFYVLGDTATRAKFMEGLSNIYKTVDTLDITSSTLPLFQAVINTFIKAYNSAYLTNYGNAEDEARRDDWYVWINDMSSKIMRSTALMQSGIKINFKGEYLWFPVKLPAPASGSITFEAKAADNVFVGLAENPYKVRNVNSRMYEIVFGKWKNKTTAIHRKSLGDQVLELDHKKYPDLALDQTSFKKYWINVNKGVISCGVGALGKNTQFEWKDPYNTAPVKFVGFSNWDREVIIKNVRIGYPILSTSKSKAFQKNVSSPTVKVSSIPSTVSAAPSKSVVPAAVVKPETIVAPASQPVKVVVPATQQPSSTPS